MAYLALFTGFQGIQTVVFWSPDFWTTNTSGSQVAPHPTSRLGQRTPPWVQHKMVVSTPLKKNSQNGKLPLNKYLKPPPREKLRLIRLVVSILLNVFFLCRMSDMFPSLTIPLLVVRFLKLSTPFTSCLLPHSWPEYNIGKYYPLVN